MPARIAMNGNPRKLALREIFSFANALAVTFHVPKKSRKDNNMRAVLIAVQVAILITLAVIGASDKGERSAHSPINASTVENHVNL